MSTGIKMVLKKSSKKILET